MVATQEKCQESKDKIAVGESIADVAKKHSTCPSARERGDLGELGPGMMVKEFDEVAFSGALNTVHAPVKTQFAYHLPEMTSRTK